MGTLVYSEQRGVIAVTPAFAEIIGRTIPEVMGARMGDFTHAEDRFATGWLLEASLKNHQPFTINKRYVRPDGEVVWVENHYEVFPGGGDDPLVVLLCRRLDSIPAGESKGVLRDCDYTEFVADMSLQLARMAQKSGRHMCADVLRLAAKVSTED